MNATTYGLDVAKSVFQLHWVDTETGEIVNRRFAGVNSSSSCHVGCPAAWR